MTQILWLKFCNKILWYLSNSDSNSDSSNSDSSNSDSSSSDGSNSDGSMGPISLF